MKKYISIVCLWIMALALFVVIGYFACSFLFFAAQKMVASDQTTTAKYNPSKVVAIRPEEPTTKPTPPIQPPGKTSAKIDMKYINGYIDATELLLDISDKKPNMIIETMTTKSHFSARYRDASLSLGFIDATLYVIEQVECGYDIKTILQSMIDHSKNLLNDFEKNNHEKIILPYNPNIV